VKIVPADAEGLREAAQAIRNDEVVAYPTETVYGLAADPFSEQALERLFQAKGRPENQPVLLVIDSAEQLLPLVAEISESARAFIDAFWPGPLSLLFPKAPGLSTRLTAGSDRVCVRCPASDTARALCRTFGGAITSSSANRSGLPPARSVSELDLPGVTLAIDGGTLPPSAPSTVYDPDAKIILREGRITRAELDRIATWLK
jgi:L-threonylcarbamoyladenylate synthase